MQRVRQTGEGNQAIQLIQGGGWMVEHTEEDGTRWAEPILAWALTVSGSVAPLTTDSDGWVEILAENTGRTRIYHPDAYEIDTKGQRRHLEEVQRSEEDGR